MMRIAEPREQPGDSIQAQDIGARRQRGQAIELRLDSGVGGDCVVGHDGRVPSVVRDRWKPSDPVLAIPVGAFYSATVSSFFPQMLA